MTNNPKLFLAIDNCFASKRWTRPKEWMGLIKDLGITLVEASADTECDPLYMGKEYLADWVAEVKKCSEKSGVRVVNLYSGHGTYATLGLAHTDERVRIRFRDQWVKAHAHTARELDAGLGFFAHAIPDPVLQDRGAYQRCLDDLYQNLANLAGYAAQIGLKSIGVEQMYSPHQPPWTIAGAKELLKTVFQTAQAPFYLTLDLGHMNGQQYFQKPMPGQISRWIEEKAAGLPCKRVWLGPVINNDIFRRAVAGKVAIETAIEQIQHNWEGYDVLFAAPEDGSVDAWIEALSGYSPILHLQQSDGKSSPHWPFSAEYNQKGIIRAEDVLRGIHNAYAKPAQDGFPPRCAELILTLEPFIATAANPADAMDEIAQSVSYWRKFLPYDGMRLSDVVYPNTDES